MFIYLWSLFFLFNGIYAYGKSCSELFTANQTNIIFKSSKSSLDKRNEIDFNHFFFLEAQEKQPNFQEIVQRMNVILKRNYDSLNFLITPNLIFGGFDLKNLETGENYFVYGSTLLESFPGIAPYSRGKFAYRFDHSNQITRKISISEFYLEKIMGEKILLNRGLSQEELQLWESFDIEGLRAVGKLKRNFGFNEPVLHFSVSMLASGWANKQSIQFEISRDLLLELIRNDEVYLGIHPTLLEVVFKNTTWPLLVRWFLDSHN